MQRQRWLIGGAIIALLGAVLSALPLGDGLARWSYDLPFLFRGHITCTNVVVVLEDRASLDALGEKQFPPSRTVHARLVDQLREEGAKLIVFDIFFRDPKPDEDAVFAAAMKRHGNVVLGSTLEITSHQTHGQAGGRIYEIKQPPDLLRTNASGPGLLVAGDLDAAFGVRKLVGAWRNHLTITAVAAGRTNLIAESAERWINFYGPPPSIDRVTMGEILQLDGRKLPPDFLRGKTVYIGFDPAVTPKSGERDVFATPFTHFGHDHAPGVEVLANAYANLVNDDVLHRLGYPEQAVLAILFGSGAVALLLFTRRRWLFLTISGLVIGLLVAIILVQWRLLVWWNWLPLVAVQLPLAGLLCLTCPRLPLVAFISYRRKGGAEFALAIRHWFRSRLCDAFLDVDDSSSGEWRRQLKEAIDRAPNFIVILSAGVSNAEGGKKTSEVMQREVLHAIATKKNIIPIQLEGFQRHSPFSVEDVLDRSSFIGRLMTMPRPIDRYLAEQLSIKTKAALSNYQGSDSDWKALGIELVSDLNKVVSQSSSIYEADRFEGVVIRPEIQQLMFQQQQVNGPQCLNPLLLEDAYPLELSRGHLPCLSEVNDIKHGNDKPKHTFDKLDDFLRE